MNAITPLCEWRERRNQNGRKEKEKWDKTKCTRTELNGITTSKREKKSSLKHPPQHHSLLPPSILPPPHLYSSSLGLADQFPLDIDYCYNCTMLITCPLESLSLSPFLAALTALHFLHLFPSQLVYISQ